MQSLIHDTRNEGDVVRFHGNKLRELFKELKISDTRAWVHLEYITGRITEIEKAIDVYYERFSKDFPETEEAPYKPQVPDAYGLTLKLLDKEKWDNEMMPTYRMLKKLMGYYTLIRNNDLDKESPSNVASPEPLTEYYEVVEIKSDFDLPKLSGSYFCFDPNGINKPYDLEVFRYSSFTHQWSDENGDGHHPSHWLKKVSNQ
jgi:hypothetical protein